MRIRIETLGCRVNRSDTAALLATLAANGYTPVDKGPFQVGLVNSCTVTSAADRETCRQLRRLRRECPEALIALTGCLATVNVQSSSECSDADLVIPGRDPLEVLSALDDALHHVSPRKEPVESLPDKSHQSRLFLKVQDGCRVRCTFCIIPDARGPSRSLLPEKVLHIVRQGLEAGFHEAILSGINLGTYGWDLSPRSSLAELVRRILKETELPRLRLGSLEPWSIRRELIEVIGEEPRLLPSLHIPLQSGSPTILKAMRRPGSLQAYERLLEALLRVRPELTFWMDVIAGFPGEREAQHRESVEAIASLPFTRLHVFPYSPRAGTPAASRPDQVPEGVRRERANELIALSHARFCQVLEARAGTVDAIVLEADAMGKAQRGHTRDNLPVHVEAPLFWLTPRKGQVLPVRLTRRSGELLLATPLEAPNEVDSSPPELAFEVP